MKGLLREARECCGRTWTDQYAWNVHVRKHKIPAGGLICEHCGKVCGETGALARHFIGHHDPVAAELRFWAKVDKAGPIPEHAPGLGRCWIWTSAVTGTGYGKFSYLSQTVIPHRWIYERMVGPIPEGLTLDHLCRTRLCMNPNHLEPVTQRENTRRGFAARSVQPQSDA